MSKATFNIEVIDINTKALDAATRVWWQTIQSESLATGMVVMDWDYEVKVNPTFAKITKQKIENVIRAYLAIDDNVLSKIVKY